MLCQNAMYVLPSDPRTLCMSSAETDAASVFTDVLETHCPIPEREVRRAKVKARLFKGVKVFIVSISLLIRVLNVMQVWLIKLMKLGMRN